MLLFATVTFAEPPPPSSQYLPSNQYGAPNFGGGGQTTAILKPNNQYGAPSRPGNDYLPPGGNGEGYNNNGGGYGGGSGGYGGGGYDDQSVSFTTIIFIFHTAIAKSAVIYGFKQMLTQMRGIQIIAEFRNAFSILLRRSPSSFRCSIIISTRNRPKESLVIIWVTHFHCLL